MYLVFIYQHIDFVKYFNLKIFDQNSSHVTLIFYFKFRIPYQETIMMNFAKE